jgi:Ca2+-binding RTX toxin-like protein
VASEVSAGETVNGNGGINTIRFTGNANVTGATFTDINAVVIGETFTATFEGSQLNGVAWSVAGTAGGVNETLVVNATAGATFSLSNLTGLTNLNGLQINGSTGTENITGSTAADSITGLAGGDNLAGGGGNDTLVGGAGSDTQSGDAGSDRFVFAAGDASSTILATLEVITDFVAADDAVALGVTGTGSNTEVTSAEATYADALTAANTLITGGTRDIVVTEAGADTFVFADTNGDNVLDTVIQLTGTGLGLAFGDFIA